jgi:hypothetical protein
MWKRAERVFPYGLVCALTKSEACMIRGTGTASWVVGALILFFGIENAQAATYQVGPTRQYKQIQNVLSLLLAGFNVEV